MADTLLATQLRKGMIIKLDNELFRIHDRQHVTPGNLRGFVRLKMRNLRNQAMAEHKARSEDVIERATLDEKEMQYLYADTAGYHFMDTDSYEQIHLTEEALGDGVGFLKPEMTIRVEFEGFGAHSDQERILESELHRFVRFQYDVVMEIAGAK
jgi:elongation factor P